ncbi:MAG TPA: hypothetical protein DDX19_02765 [Rhodopirellula baltica]|nr:hypothetical protein [Rhodopirellula baltica]
MGCGFESRVLRCQKKPRKADCFARFFRRLATASEAAHQIASSFLPVRDGLLDRAETFPADEIWASRSRFRSKSHQVLLLATLAGV